jgi:HEAT repeat protein
MGVSARPAISTLSNLVTQSDMSVRSSAAFALSQIGPESLPVFCGLLSNTDGQLRVEGVKGILFLRKYSTNATKELLRLAEDSDWRVRNSVVMALRVSMTNQNEFVSFVMARLASEEYRLVWDHLLSSLGQVGEPATNALPLLKRLAENAEGDRKDQLLMTIAVVDPSLAKDLGADETMLRIARLNRESRTDLPQARSDLETNAALGAPPP